MLVAGSLHNWKQELEFTHEFNHLDPDVDLPNWLVLSKMLPQKYVNE